MIDKKLCEQYLEERWDEIVWSPSRVSTGDCLLNFYLTYIKGVRDNGNYFAYRGSGVHEGQEDYYNYVLGGGKPLPLEVIRETLSKKFSKYMEKSPHKAELLLLTKKGKLYSKAQDEWAIINSINNFVPMTNVVAVEREIEFKVGKYNFRGRLDIENEENGVKWHSDFKSAWKQDDYQMQQYLYAYGKGENEGKLPPKFDIIEYNNNFRTVPIDVEADTLKRVLQVTEHKIDNLRKNLEDLTIGANPKDRFSCLNFCKKCEYGNP